MPPRNFVSSRGPRPARPLAALCACLLLIAPAVAFAADATDTDTVRKLAQRVEQLEKELKEIKANGPAADTSAEDIQPAYPRVRLNLFADVNYRTSNAPQSHGQFDLGELDLFIKSTISAKASVLAETVVAANDANNFGFEIERLLFEYRANSSFNIAFGRFHTAIGYYNNAFHHGKWFQTATGRPDFLKFEDEGGLIPAHNIGVTVNGDIPASGALGLHYVAEVGNGRSYASPASGNGPVLNISDNNGGKAFNVQLSARPQSVPGLQFGTGFYHDNTSPDGQPRTEESIWHNFLVYKSPQWEFLSEYLTVTHKPTGQRTTRSTAWFAQLARQFGALRPYARYTYSQVPVSDGAFGVVGSTGKKTGPAVGVRWDFETYAAFKVQYDQTKVDGQSNLDELSFQLAFTF